MCFPIVTVLICLPWDRKAVQELPSEAVRYYCHCYYDFMRRRDSKWGRLCVCGWVKDTESGEDGSDERMRTGDKETVLRSTERLDKTHSQSNLQSKSQTLTCGYKRLPLAAWVWEKTKWKEERDNSFSFSFSQMYYSHSCTDWVSHGTSGCRRSKKVKDQWLTSLGTEVAKCKLSPLLVTHPGHPLLQETGQA